MAILTKIGGAELWTPDLSDPVDVGNLSCYNYNETDDIILEVQLTGWFVADFLGVKYAELEDIPSGLNVVPLTVTDGFTEEQSALVAGVTGYSLTEEELTDPDSKVTFPSVQSVLGWGLLMDQNSKFK